MIFFFFSFILLPVFLTGAPLDTNHIYCCFCTFKQRTITMKTACFLYNNHLGKVLSAWGAYSFKPSAGIAGKCTQNRLQIPPIYVSTKYCIIQYTALRL